MKVQYFLPEISFDDGDGFFTRFMAALHDLDDISGGYVETDYEESASQIKTQFSDEDETTHITAWEDFVARLRYVEVAAADVDKLQAIADAMASHFALVEHDSLLDQMVRSEFSDPSDFYRLAYSAPVDFAPKTFEVVKTALSSPSDQVREKAAIAAGLLGWVEFSPLLAELHLIAQPGASKQAIENAQRALSGGS